MLSTLVKISNVTNLSDARYCAGMGVEWIGFSIDEENANYVSPKKFNEIRSWLVGVNVLIETSKSIDFIQQALSKYEVEGVQVGPTHVIQAVKEATGKVVFVAIDVDAIDPLDLKTIVEANKADYFVLESSSDVELSSIWKEVIIEESKNANLLLGFGLTDADHTPALVTELTVAGIALRGSEEIRPGFKDFGDLMDILEQLEED